MFMRTQTYISNLQYGRASCSPALFRVYSLCKIKNMTGAATSGFLLDKEKAIELAESGLDEIRFSFEGENPELYEKSEEAVIIIEFLKTYNIF